MKGIIQLLLIIFLLQNTLLTAQTKTWIGTTSDNWNTASNWNPNGVPTATDEVDIPNVTNDPRIPSILILNIKSLTVQSGAKLTIHGNTTLNIKDAPLNGVLNEGTIDNYGKIILTNAGSTSGAPNSGIKNEGTFTNRFTAEIKMTNTRHAGIRNNGTFGNAGKIIIESVSLLGRGIIVFGTFHNQEDGEIRIKEVATGMSCFTPFTNEGTIVVSHYDSNGIGNQGSFKNKKEGKIFLDGGWRAISISKSTFTNEGKIDIGATTVPETGIFIGGGTFNQFVNSGELNIFGVTKNGIFNNDKSKFRNLGTINIGQNQIGHRGIQNQNIFENESGGELTIYPSNDSNILNGGTLADFSDGSTPFLPPAQFTNYPCAILRVAGRIYNGENSTFTNKGFLFSDYQGHHNNQEIFINVGVIQNLSGAFGGNIENQDIIVQSRSTCGDSIFTNVLEIGNDKSFSISNNWYLEETMNNVVGNYDATSNVLTTALTGGNHTLYFEATDADNNCTQIMQISLIVDPSPIPIISGDLSYCARDQHTYLDAGNWNTYKWSSGQNTQTIEANGGTYYLTVTNGLGCSGTSQVTVVENENPNPSITGELEYCRGRETTLDAGQYNLASQTYQWSNGETAQYFTTTLIGVYTVTVTNQEGCSGTATAEVSQKPCFADAGIISTNAETICSDDAVEIRTLGEQSNDNYLQYFFVYQKDNLGNTTFEQGMRAENELGKSVAEFSGLEAGNYIVCAYNECQDCLPNPSPVTTDLDDIYQTGSIQDGCYDIECTSIIVPEAFEPNLTGTGQADENNSTGNNVYIVEVCGGTAPYHAGFTFLGGFASVAELPSENVGCINYQIVYTDFADWTLTVIDANDCNNSDVIFTSEGLPSNPLPQITAINMTPETCVGDKDGSVTIDVEGGEGTCGNYTYEWFSSNGFSATTINGTTANTVNDLAAGSYSVTVTDCAGTTTVQTGINITRSNIGGRSGRGRGGCKTVGNDWSEANEWGLEVFPNPFVEQALIEFSLPTDSKVWLSVYSLEGRKIVSLLEGANIGGNSLQRFSLEGSKLECGVYILELQNEFGLRQHKQLVVVR